MNISGLLNLKCNYCGFEWCVKVKNVAGQKVVGEGMPDNNIGNIRVKLDIEEPSVTCPSCDYITISNPIYQSAGFGLCTMIYQYSTHSKQWKEKFDQYVIKSVGESLNAQETN